MGRFDTVDCPPPQAEYCFTAFLSDTYGDSWNGNVLTIEIEGTGEVVHQLTQSGYITAFVEEAFEVCFECGSCFAADVGGGSYESETAWNIKDAQGGTIAKGRNSKQTHISLMLNALHMNTETNEKEPSGKVDEILAGSPPASVVVSARR